jgi:hypothetical protein
MTIVNNAAYEIPGFTLGVLEANIAFLVESSQQFLAVDVISATGTGLLGPAAIGLPASSGAAMLGVLQNNPGIAEAAIVVTDGVSKALAGGTFAIGAILTVNAAGQFVTAASGNYGCAKALQNGASGTIVSVFLKNYGKQ